MAPQLDGYFKQVDALSDHFIDRLRKAVAIPSVSSDDERRPEVVRMGKWLAGELTALGAEVELRPLGKQPGKEIDLPPVVIARYGNDKKKRTILVYGHYDVQPAGKEDGWATEPFELSIDAKDRMYGRGSTDDKGPVLGWLNAIEAHQKAGIDFPVNLLMCFEGMEENGSEGLDDFIRAEAKKFFADADAVCISDNYWLGTDKPCLTYGLRGCSYYSVEISGPGQDLHSGVFGGTAHEPMTDLVRVLASLVEPDGTIKIPGLAELVAPLTDDEKALYTDIAFGMDNIYESLGSQTTIFPDKERTLMARWRYPSLSVHGVEGAFSQAGAKTVIPAKVAGKFSIRTVPNMELADVDRLVFAYVNDEFKKLGSKNTMNCTLVHTGKWWVASPKHWNFSAAAKATERVWGVKPDLTREGGRYVAGPRAAAPPRGALTCVQYPRHPDVRGGHGQERASPPHGHRDRRRPLHQREVGQEELHRGHQVTRRLPALRRRGANAELDNRKFNVWWTSLIFFGSGVLFPHSVIP
jgi:Cys-Gly metallodipeptidase DUG1